MQDQDSLRHENTQTALKWEQEATQQGMRLEMCVAFKGENVKSPILVMASEDGLNEAEIIFLCGRIICDMMTEGEPDVSEG